VSLFPNYLSLYFSCLPIFLSVCQSICFTIYILLFVFPYFCLSLNTSACLSILLSVSPCLKGLSICINGCLYIPLSVLVLSVIRLSFLQSICLSACLPTPLSALLSHLFQILIFYKNFSFKSLKKFFFRKFRPICLQFS
jgi:hypothetical protein